MVKLRAGKQFVAALASDEACPRPTIFPWSFNLVVGVGGLAAAPCKNSATATTAANIDVARIIWRKDNWKPGFGGSTFKICNWLFKSVDNKQISSSSYLNAIRMVLIMFCRCDARGSSFQITFLCPRKPFAKELGMEALMKFSTEGVHTSLIRSFWSIFEAFDLGF